MIALLQRVSQARVEIAGETVGAIGPGLLVLVCAEPGDTEAVGQRLLAKVLRLRIFADDLGKMNRSLQDVLGGLLNELMGSRAGEPSSGSVPGFSGAARAALGEALYNAFVAAARAAHQPVATGRFGADMQVHLVNDGPVTIPLRMAG